MKFFDFHLHPVFKKYICKFESEYPGQVPVEDIMGDLDLKNVVLDFLDTNLLHILESQACYNQLTNGNFALGVAAIAPIEAVFTEKEGFFGKLLNSKITRPVDLQFFDTIRNREISYYQLFIRELNIYRRLRDANKITVLSRGNGQLPGEGRICVAIGMEGGHSLSRCKVRQPGVADTFTVTPGKGDAVSDDFVKNPLIAAPESLQNLQQAMWQQGMDLCYLILTHLSYIPEQLLASHAYGIKMIKSTTVYPRGAGITPAGKDVIDAAYNLTVTIDGQVKKAPVLLDIKHMSLKSRLDFYAYRREKGYDRFPILASHMGVTGYAIEEWKTAIESDELVSKSDTPVVSIVINRKEAGNWGVINKKFTFNAWSINLMDEDIREVLDSNGYIGISLDVRILGWQMGIAKGDKEEILSWEDYRFLFPERAAQLAKRTGFVESFLVPTAEERHPLSLCFNILHIVWVGKTYTDRKPWEHICIGSDFDGLIDPVVNCRNATRYPNLETNLLKWLPIADKAYCDGNNTDSLLPRKANGTIDQPALQKCVENVLYGNGRRFIEQWVTGSYV